jgi:hypothetical protein
MAPRPFGLVVFWLPGAMWSHGLMTLWHHGRHSHWLRGLPGPPDPTTTHLLVGVQRHEHRQPCLRPHLPRLVLPRRVVRYQDVAGCDDHLRAVADSIPTDPVRANIQTRPGAWCHGFERPGSNRRMIVPLSSCTVRRRPAATPGRPGWLGSAQARTRDLLQMGLAVVAGEQLDDRHVVVSSRFVSHAHRSVRSHGPRSPMPASRFSMNAPQT